MIPFSWDQFFDASGVTGLLAFLWQIVDKSVSFGRRPRLQFLPFDQQRDLRVWTNATPDGTTRRVFTLEVINTGASLAIRCVASLTLHKFPANVRLAEPRFVLHWASSEINNRTSGVNPIDIGSEGNRVDVAFCQEGQPFPGAWAATMLSFTVMGMHQSYLPPGEYEGTIRVSCSNGSGAKLKVRLYSPENWKDLNASILA